MWTLLSQRRLNLSSVSGPVGFHADMQAAFFKDLVLVFHWFIYFFHPKDCWVISNNDSFECFVNLTFTNVNRAALFILITELSVILKSWWFWYNFHFFVCVCAEKRLEGKSSCQTDPLAFTGQVTLTLHGICNAQISTLKCCSSILPTTNRQDRLWISLDSTTSRLLLQIERLVAREQEAPSCSWF